MSRKAILTAALVGFGALCVDGVPRAAAETDWPSRTVNVIIPWAAGGGTDPLARVIFDDMSRRLGQPFVLDFRPGAAGTVGTHAAARSRPDGYTMLFTSGAPVVNANFMAAVSYDPKTDVVPVGQATVAPIYVAANAETPYDTFEELIDFAKANPGEVDAAFSGIGGNSHLAVVIVQERTATQFNVVPYTGSGAQQADLMGGIVDLGFGFATSFIPGVEAGRLKYLAAMAAERSDLMPDIPATDESGYEGVHLEGWFMAFAPGGTPQEILDRMNAELRQTLADPAIVQQINKLGYEVRSGSAEDAAAVIERDTAEMGKLVEAGVFKIE